MTDNKNVKIMFFDIETLSTKNEAVVLSMGFVPVDFEVCSTFQELVAGGLEVKMQVEEQVAAGREVERSTLDWWKKQGDSAKRVLTPREDDVQMKDFYESISSLGFIQKANWYAKGPHFDMAITSSLFNDFNIKEPWGYNQVRDVRTALEWAVGDTMPYDREKLISDGTLAGFINHNAVHDAAFDAWQTLQILHGKYTDG